jgi:hypothetical protein
MIQLIQFCKENYAVGGIVLGVVIPALLFLYVEYRSVYSSRRHY